MLGLKHEDSTDESGKESDETIEGSGDRTTICIGDKEKEFAHSKLSALISLLEKDREFSSIVLLSLPNRNKCMAMAMY